MKIAGLENLVFEGPARVFEGEDACFNAVQNKEINAGEVLVIRNEGPKGGPGAKDASKYIIVIA